MKYLKRFNESDKWWDRRKDVILGKVEGWESMTDEERIKYLNPDYSKLEIEFEGITRDYITKAKLNWMLFLLLDITVSHLKKIDRQFAFEVMYRVTEMENPIRIIKDILEKHPDYDFSWKDKMIQVSELSGSVNPFVDFVDFLNH